MIVSTMTECNVVAVSSMEVPRSIEGVVVSSTPSSSSPGTPKTRRKRKKKKKKKKRPEPVSSDEEDFGIPNNTTKKKNDSYHNQQQQSNAPSGASNISTPQEVLRNRLIENDGYEAAQIEQAMEEMWDKGMPFDEYESVVRYLQSRDAPTLCGTGTMSTASNSLLSVSTREEDLDSRLSSHSKTSQSESLDDLEEEKGEGFATIIETPSGEITSSKDEEDENDFEEAQEDEEKEEEEADNEEESIEKPAAARRPTTMAMKLDTVASFENLTDAIFALTQWVKMAASDEEIELFCRAETTSALPTVIRRGLSSEIDDTSQFESAVQPALVRLLIAVLNRIHEIGAEFRGELEEPIGKMLKQTRKVSLLACSDDNDDWESMIGDRVSRFIVSKLTIAMDQVNQYHKLQGESCSSVLLQDDLTMAALLSLRNDLRTNAIRACNQAQHSMEAVLRDTTAANGKSSPNPSEDITLHIVDQDTKTKFDQDKIRLRELQSQVREEGESSETVQNLRESLASLETKRSGYQDRIAELTAALEEAKAQEKEASVQIESLSTQLIEEEQTDAAKAKQLEQDISQTKETVRHGNLVSGLAGMMKSYGKSIERATNTAKGNDSVDESPTNGSTSSTKEATLRAAMEDYLVKIRNYFVKEAHCFTKLHQRLTTKTAEITALQSELSQYKSVKSLFATSAIPTQVQKAIDRNERLIQAYQHELDAHTDDGNLMYQELLSKLEDYNAKTAESKAFFPSELLRGVPGALQALKIAHCDKLATFVKEEEEEATSKESVENATATNNENSPISTRTAVASSSPNIAPKLVWASAKKDLVANKEPKKSLLDIQKEELDIRDNSTQSKDTTQSRNSSTKSKDTTQLKDSSIKSKDTTQSRDSSAKSKETTQSKDSSTKSNNEGSVENGESMKNEGSIENGE